MADNIIKQSGSFKSSKNDSGNILLFPSAVKGIVKNNIDVTRTGLLEVYLEQKSSSATEDRVGGWVKVRYMSPFFGYTPNTGGKTDNGTFVTNPNSYGMWMTPPDIGTEVICVFLNGDPSQGYYLGSIPTPGINHMVPAIGSSDRVIPNSGEAKSYGGATRLPVSEINNANPSKGQNAVVSDQARPVHSVQAAILFNQGLLRDSDRGTIGSSSQRESPSRVFGISTPGRPIYQGGYDGSTIKDAIKDDTTPDDKFKIIGRLGGHSFVMDDGDIVGKDQLVRLRTAQGHMIMMNDAAQTLFIIHANGQSYIELGKEGTIDMYSTNSVNIRTQGDLNLHADRNINLHAGKDGTGDVNIHAENIKMESNKETSQYVGTTFKGYTKGDYTQKNESKTSILSAGEFGVKSKNSVAVLDGTNVKLNSGDPTLVPQEVKQLPITAHPDTLRDDGKGWAPAPGKLPSITSRAPAHSPWSNANYGIDIKIDNSSSSNFPAAPPASTTAVNNAIDTPPQNVTSPALAATTPSVPGASASLDVLSTKAVLSQVAVTAATGDLKDAVAAGAGVVTDNGTSCAVLGAYGAKVEHLVDSGHLKDGADTMATKLINDGKSLTEALPPNAWTGKDGIKNVQDFINDPATQAKAMVANLGSAENKLTAAGLLPEGLSGTQTAGMVAGAAVAGVAAVKDFASKASGLSIPGVPSISDITASVAGKLPSSVGDLMAGAKFAGDLADKAMNSLSGIKLGGFDPAAALKGFSAGLFSTVLKDFEDLKAGAEANLTKLKEAKDAAKAKLNDLASGTGLSLSGLPTDPSALLNNPLVAQSAATFGGLTSVTSAVTSAANSIPGLNALAGGASAVTNIVSKATSFSLTSIPGVGDLAGKADALKGALTGGLDSLKNAAQGLKDKLNGASLEVFAKAGLSDKDAEALSAKIASMAPPGATPVQLAVVATATATQLPTAALAGLAGSDKFKIDFSGTNPGDTPPDTATQAKVGDIANQLDAEQSNYDTLKTAFETAQAQYGVDSSEAKAALATYSASAQKIADYTSQLENIPYLG